jgi:hypothetical protein
MSALRRITFIFELWTRFRPHASVPCTSYLFSPDRVIDKPTLLREINQLDFLSRYVKLDGEGAGRYHDGQLEYGEYSAVPIHLYCNMSASGRTDAAVMQRNFGVVEGNTSLPADTSVQHYTNIV